MTATHLTLNLASDSESPFIDYTIQLVKWFCGIKIRLIDPDHFPDTIDIYHGNDNARSCSLRIPYQDHFSADDIILVHDSNDFSGSDKPDNPFPFDIFSALRFCLADEANSTATKESYDSHDRLKASYSWQNTRDVLDIPIVNHYLILFREWLKKRFHIEPCRMLPDGKRCGIVLSHDVDSPVNYGDPFHALWITQRCLRRGHIQRSFSYLKEAIIQSARQLKRPGQKWWLFREIMDVEARYGFKSTFFFASQPRFNHSADPLDVWYDVSAPRFLRLFSELKEREFEIGLHTSYNAYKHFSRIANERHHLEDLSGQPVLGNRHHFWHMRRPFWDTLEDHARAGLKYDSSIGFNDSPGFRLGTGIPFYPWNPEKETVIKSLQIPVLAMDGVFLGTQPVTLDTTLERIKLLIDKLKDAEGFAALDWHVRNSYPGSVMCRFLGDLYLEVIGMLAADPEILVTDCRTMYKDLIKRLEHQ